MNQMSVVQREFSSKIQLLDKNNTKTTLLNPEQAKNRETNAININLIQEKSQKQLVLEHNEPHTINSVSNDWTRPPEWQDEERMDVLFGNLLHNFEDKFRFWCTLIHNSSRELDTPYISLPLLQERFKRNQLTPIGLDRVIVLLFLFFSSFRSPL
jgi:hypothetical protein